MLFLFAVMFLLLTLVHKFSLKNLLPFPIIRHAHMIEQFSCTFFLKSSFVFGKIISDLRFYFMRGKLEGHYV